MSLNQLSDIFYRGNGQVDIQVGGPGNPWAYFDPSATMSGVTLPTGGVDQRWEQDPEGDGDSYRVSSLIQSGPDLISGNVNIKLRTANKLKKLSRAFGLRARYADCEPREAPDNWSKGLLSFNPVAMVDPSLDDLVSSDPNNQDEIMVDIPFTTPYHTWIKSVKTLRLGTAAQVGDQTLLSIIYGHDCEDDGSPKPESIVYAVSGLDSSPYTNPSLIKMEVDFVDDSYTWLVEPIIGIATSTECVQQGGNRLMVTSNGDSVFAYNDKNGLRDHWNTVSLANAPAATPTAMHARTSKEVWIAAAGGYIYRSKNGGLSFTAVHSGTLTTQNLTSIHAFDSKLIVAGGPQGVLLKSADGGESWEKLDSGLAVQINVVRIPKNRKNEIFFGTEDGRIFKSLKAGALDNGNPYFSQVNFPNDGSGTIDQLKFHGQNGEIMFILHNDSTPRGRVYRDVSGGAAGNDTGTILLSEDVITSGLQLNDIAINRTDANEITSVGVLNDSKGTWLRTFEKD